MSMPLETTCPIWGTPAYLLASGDGVKVQSDRTGGEYRISGTAQSMLESLSPEQRARLTTWLVDQRRAGDPSPMINSDEIKRARERRPLLMSERKDRFFLALARQNVGADFRMKFRGEVDDEYKRNGNLLNSWLEFSRDAELGSFLRLLIQEQLVVDEGGYLILTPKGWDRLDQVERGALESSQAFCAMWFDPTLEQAFDDAIAPAIEAAGYRAFRVDRKEHVNKIDDEIIAEIRRSRFIVADVTCGVVDAGDQKIGVARGGVYYEAGFAHGLGMPVIWTCREDCMSYVHFDTRQFAHIVWQTADDLKLKLYNRIGHVIGFAADARPLP